MASPRLAVAYVDTSVLVAIALGEPDGSRARHAIRRAKRLCSSNLLEAEFRAVLAREELSAHASRLLSPIGWIQPDRPLSQEIDRALQLGYLRGADLWHVATALFFATKPRYVWFATLDANQANVAAKLGFHLLL